MTCASSALPRLAGPEPFFAAYPARLTAPTEPSRPPDPRLELIRHRPRRRPLIPRRPFRPHRRANRVPGDLHDPGDLLDRQALRPVQPADLCPVLH